MKVFKKIVSLLLVVNLCSFMAVAVHASENPAHVASDGGTLVANITDPTPEEENTILLSDFPRAKEQSATVHTEAVTDSHGIQHTENVISLDSSTLGYVVYNLDGLYDSFTAKVVCAEGTAEDVNTLYSFFADGVQLYVNKISPNQEAQEVSISLSGVGQLTIKTNFVQAGGSILIFDGVFTEAEHPNVYPTRKHLSTCSSDETANVNKIETMIVDSASATHDGGIIVDASSGETSIVFNLGREYLVFTGSVVSLPQTAADCSLSVMIYLDEELIFQQDGITGGAAANSFVLDVEEGDKLKITVSPSSAVPNSVVCVADPYLRRHEHTPGEWIVEKESTCAEHGLRYLTCSECDERTVSETLPLKEHTPDGNVQVIKEATCSEEGIQAQHCTVCGCELNAEAIPVIPHTPDDEWVVVKEATCTEKGLEARYCTVCEEIAESREIETVRHVSGNWFIAKDPTCSSEGLKNRYCTVCGAELDEETIPMLDHEMSGWETVEGNIWSGPIEKERHCLDCDYVETKTIRAMMWVKPSVYVLGGLVVLIALLFIPIKRKKAVMQLSDDVLKVDKSVFAEMYKDQAGNVNDANSDTRGSVYSSDSIGSTDWSPNVGRRTQVLSIDLDDAIANSEDWDQVRKMLNESEKRPPSENEK